MMPLLTTAEIAKMLKISEEMGQSSRGREAEAHSPGYCFKVWEDDDYRFNLEEIEAWLKKLQADDVIQHAEQEKLKRKRWGIDQKKRGWRHGEPPRIVTPSRGAHSKEGIGRRGSRL